MKVNLYHNGDDVFIAWKPKGFIPECRGFAVLRRRNGVEETMNTWVGFEKDKHDEGERRASTNWPVSGNPVFRYVKITNEGITG